MYTVPVGLSGRAATRPGHAGDGHRHVHIVQPQCALGHLLGHLRADRAHRHQRVVVDAEHAFLGVVAVDNGPAGEVVGTARVLGDQMADETAGAAFGCGAGEIGCAQSSRRSALASVTNSS